MRVCSGKQGTFEWYEARKARITGSRIVDVMATLKRGDGEAAARRDYRTELLVERLTGTTVDHYVSKEMEFGSANEPIARTEYELAANVIVDEVGFVLHPTIDFTGSSPDGLVGSDGCIEIKVPKTATHLTYLTAGVVPEEYRDQCLWHMACTGREYTDFICFDPRLPKNLQLFIKRLHRDDERIAKIEAGVKKLHAEVEFLITQLGGESILPPIESFLADGQPKQKQLRTERIGDIDVPCDVLEAIGADEDYRI